MLVMNLRVDCRLTRHLVDIDSIEFYSGRTMIPG